jgi:hypothetical protein
VSDAALLEKFAAQPFAKRFLKIHRSRESHQSLLIELTMLNIVNGGRRDTSTLRLKAAPSALRPLTFNVGDISPFPGTWILQSTTPLPRKARSNALRI